MAYVRNANEKNPSRVTNGVYVLVHHSLSLPPLPFLSHARFWFRHIYSFLFHRSVVSRCIMIAIPHCWISYGQTSADYQRLCDLLRDFLAACIEILIVDFVNPQRALSTRPSNRKWTRVNKSESRALPTDSTMHRCILLVKCRLWGARVVAMHFPL